MALSDWTIKNLGPQEEEVNITLGNLQQNCYKHFEKEVHDSILKAFLLDMPIWMATQHASEEEPALMIISQEGIKV